MILDTYINELIQHRRWFHQHPETAFKEYETSEYIRNYLKEIKVDKIWTEAKTGVVCEIGEGGSRHAARFNMDALPIHEENDIEYCSLYQGYSHSCGHDFELAWGLMIAKYFQENKPKGTLRLIFQPAEEGAGEEDHGKTGGQILAGLGIFDVDTIMSFHVDPEIPLRTISITTGEVTCGAYDFEFTLEGKMCQAAKPELGKNPIPHAFNLGNDIYRLQEKIRSEIITEDNFVLITVTIINTENQPGKPNNEETVNTIPRYVIIKGICRFRSGEIKEKLLSGFRDLEAKYKLILEDCVLKFPQVAVATINDKRCVDNVVKVADELNLNVVEKRANWRDDAGWASERAPSAYGFVGIFDGKQMNLHSPTFNPNEDGLAIGLGLFIKALEKNFSNFKK